MEDRYGTFQREVAPSRPEPPPLKPLRQIRRPEMYPSRRMQENTAALLQHQQPPPVARTQPREPSVPRHAPLRKAPSTQNLSQTDTPWESVTLNRCLFVAVTILLVASGFQKMHEAVRGRRIAREEEFALSRRSGALKHRMKPSEPQTSLWEIVFWWVPDLTDGGDEEEDEEGGGGNTKRGRSKRAAADRTSRGLRHRPLRESLMKPRENKLRDRRRKKTKDDSEDGDTKKKLPEKNSHLEETEEDNVNEGRKEKPSVHKV